MKGKELPNSWIETTIKETNFKKSQNIDPSKFASTKFELYSIPIFETGNPEIIQGNEIGSTKQVVAENDVLICKINPRINRVWKVGNFSEYKKIASSEWIVYDTAGKIDADYSRYVFSAPFFRYLLQSEVSGVGGSLTRARPKIVENYKFPLPPFAEQQRIVAKLDSLFGRIEKLKTSMERIPQLLKDFCQAVLTQAVTGKLTEEWREGRDLDDWEEKILSDLTELDVGQAFKSAEFEDSGIRLLRGENIEPGALRWNKTVYFPESKLEKFSHLYIKEGDVILAMDRPIISSGLKVAKVKKNDLPCVLVQRVARFRTTDKLSPNFLYIQISSQKYIHHLFGEQTGTQIPHISSKQILSFKSKFPPLIEQQEIVRRVESLFAKADKIEAQYQTLKEKLEQLPQALLAKALSGELVEQLPTDGDARELLEEIKQAKAELNNTTKPKRGKSKKLKQEDERVNVAAEDRGRYGKNK